MGDRASDQGRRISRRRRHGSGDAGPHHGRHRVAGRGRRRMAGTHGRPAGRATTGPDTDHHRPARHRLRGRASAQAATLDARPRAPRHRRVRGARRADDEHLHQLPDHHAAGARRARRLWRHRGGDLLQQRVRRALELRGRTFRAERRAHRPHAALRLSSRRAAGGHAGRQRGLDAARAQRLGRARRDRGPPGRRLLAGPRARRHRSRAGLRRDEAFRRGARELRLGRALPHDRHHAGSAAHRRRRGFRRDAADTSRSAKPMSVHSRRAMRARSMPSIWSCSRRRS